MTSAAGSRVSVHLVLEKILLWRGVCYKDFYNAQSSLRSLEGNFPYFNKYSRVPIIRPSVVKHSIFPMCRVGTLHFINSHSEGLNSIETALAYFEQQREATATDVLLFRRWRDLAAKKRKEAQKQIPIRNFLKKINTHLQIYIMLNTIFVCEIFFI
jgi:hypothetical protein